MLGIEETECKCAAIGRKLTLWRWIEEWPNGKGQALLLGDGRHDEAFDVPSVHLKNRKRERRGLALRPTNLLTIRRFECRRDFLEKFNNQSIDENQLTHTSSSRFTHLQTKQCFL